MIALLAVTAAAFAAQAPSACPADQPAAMALAGLPAVAVTGKAYEMALVPSGAPTMIAGGGSTLSLFDANGAGWSAKYGYVASRQAFTVGLNGPYTASGAYNEQLGSGSCLRTLTIPLPIERRIYAVAGCRRRAIEPAAITLRCGGGRVKLRGLTWTGWNGDRAIGRGDGVRVVLSQPRECSTLDGFIYTRAKLRGHKKLIPIGCPVA